MSRRLFCGSQAPPSSTPELLPVPVQLAKETRLTVKPNREDDSAEDENAERGGDRGSREWCRAAKIYDYLPPARRAEREREREREERGSLSLSLSFHSRSVPRSFLRSRVHTPPFPHRVPILERRRRRRRARRTAHRAPRGLFGCVIYAELPRSCN